MLSDFFQNKTFRWTLWAIIGMEALSLSGWLYPPLGQVVFVLLCLVVLLVSLFDLKSGLYVLLAELIIGSKGYLFFWQADGNQISIRIAFWLIIMSVWLAKEINHYWLKKKWDGLWIKSKFKYYWLALFIVLIGGCKMALFNKNDFSNIFLDANNWLYLLLLFPIYRSWKKNDWPTINKIIIAGVSWLVLKTFFLLYAFSHNLFLANYELYHWVRQTGVGEITMMAGNFYRLFFQSHIFILLAFFALLILFAERLRAKCWKRDVWFYICGSSLLLAVIALSLSRSFYLGLAGGLLAFIIFLLLNKFSKKHFLQLFSGLAMSLIFGIILVVAIVKFPYPNPLAFSAGDLLSQRIDLSQEAGASSRWSLWPALWQGVKKNPIFGQGFGAEITYKTSDPRVLEQSIDGLYTTYAFEWGWLDIWLKFGVLGLLIYLALLGKIVVQAWRDRAKLGSKSAWIIFGIVCLTSVHFFYAILKPSARARLSAFGKLGRG